ncbi:hypothetical protein GCM10022204_17370 [Microlunatus aurantiacus]|uniref:Tetratricopeptide repeat-containing protein n=1 Tax=Microlunatus aurantiacus TaxID=446786 RepID=A0ABP7D961_9ACTN
MAERHPAEQLLTEADHLVKTGRLVAAAALIRQAAQVYAAEGRAEDEARCLVLAATAARLGGALSAAQADADGARRAAPADPETAVQAVAELAESLVAAGRPVQAIGEYTTAIERWRDSRGEPGALAVLLHRRGLAHALADRPDEAIDDLQAAAEQFAAAGLPRAERAVLVEAATLATERSTPQRGARLRAWARTAAARAGDQEAEVDLDLLDAALAVTGEDLDRALSLTWRARQRALDGVAPVKYLSAAIALAELHDLRGEHGSAYEALSTAWATLADLMGSETARAVVQPRLQLLVDRWGVEEFTAVKKRYEARRRAQLGLA